MDSSYNMAQQPPLNYENSLYPTTNHHTGTSLPPEVVQCLKNARYLHLATIAKPVSASDPPIPHVSLMNYTFLSNYNDEGPVILMTTNAQSLKTQNLRHNPRVSLLVHDWSSHRPPTAVMPEAGATARAGSPPAVPARSSLANMLLNLNTSALSSISTTISGEARFLEAGSEEEKWCKEAHLQNNTFEGQLSTEAGFFGSGGYGGAVQQSTEKASGYIEGNDVWVVVVPIKKGRISDFKGGVRDWSLVEEEESSAAFTPAVATSGYETRGRQESLVNGLVNQN